MRPLPNYFGYLCAVYGTDVRRIIVRDYCVSTESGRLIGCSQ